MSVMILTSQPMARVCSMLSVSMDAVDISVPTVAFMWSMTCCGSSWYVDTYNQYYPQVSHWLAAPILVYFNIFCHVSCYNFPHEIG